LHPNIAEMSCSDRGRLRQGCCCAKEIIEDKTPGLPQSSPIFTANFSCTAYINVLQRERRSVLSSWSCCWSKQQSLVNSAQDISKEWLVLGLRAYRSQEMAGVGSQR
jgi:hypothetical protein